MKPIDRGANTRITLGLSSLAYAALLIDSDARILASNPAARRVFGYLTTPPEGRLINELIPDLSSNDSMDLLASRKRPRLREIQCLRQDGARIPLRVGFTWVKRHGSSLGLLRVQDLTHRKYMGATLRDSRYGFRQLAKALPYILWACTPDGAAEYFAPQWTAFTGVPLASTLGSGWLNQVHDDDRSALEQSRTAAVSAGETFKAEFRVRRHDGEYHWFETTLVPVRDRDDLIVHWIGTITDIHEARHNRMALTLERDRFAKLVASVPGAIHAFQANLDGSSSFPLASVGIKDLLGVSAETLARPAAGNAANAHPDDFPGLAAALAWSARKLTPLRHEWRVLHPQKGEVWVEAHSIPTREADGSTVWYGVMMDVTERKAAAEELRRSQARLQAAVMAGGIGTWIWDVTTDQLWCDDVLLKLFDRKREEVGSGGIAGAAPFVVAEDRPLIAAAMAAAREGKTDILTLEYRTVRRDAALQWVAVNGRVERDEQGRITRVTGACMDITARKRAQDAQRHSQKLEALGTLAGGIAHDFNNLLLAITGNTRLALEDLPGDHPLRGSLAEIDRASTRATSLVKRILAFSRQSEPKREVIPPGPIVEEALRLLRASLPAMVAIRHSVGADVPEVHVYSTELHQAVMNLVTNAAQSMGEKGGVITVATESVTIQSMRNAIAGDLQPGRYACVSIADTGCGMDRGTIERIFDPFFTTKAPGQGTGLGLSVVHGIVRSHEGAMTVYSEPGQGSVFRVYLPAAAGTVAQPRAVTLPQAHGKGQRVMYVDDEDALVYLVTRMLERMGYKVSGFVDPGKALQTFQQTPDDYDVIVTDLSMPGMSGFDLAQVILQVRPQMPIVMVSGYVRPADREHAQRLGVRDLILKPDTLEELGRALQRSLASDSDQT